MQLKILLRTNEWLKDNGFELGSEGYMLFLGLYDETNNTFNVLLAIGGFEKGYELAELIRM